MALLRDRKVNCGCANASLCNLNVVLLRLNGSNSTLLYVLCLTTPLSHGKTCITHGPLLVIAYIYGSETVNVIKMNGSCAIVYEQD